MPVAVPYKWPYAVNLETQHFSPLFLMILEISGDHFFCTKSVSIYNIQWQYSLLGKNIYVILVQFMLQKFQNFLHGLVRCYLTKLMAKLIKYHKVHHNSTKQSVCLLSSHRAGHIFREEACILWEFRCWKQRYEEHTVQRFNGELHSVYGSNIT